MVIPDKKRNIGLDIARSLAMFLVLFSHSIWISDHYPKPILTLMQMSGTIGVEVFFIISGFLIGKIILRDINRPNYSFKNVRRFIVRRWIRIFPNYYLILLINVVIWFSIYNELPKSLYKYIIYIQNFFSPSPAFYRISWSLSVEQFSYLIVPIAVYFIIAIFKDKDRTKLFFYTSLVAVVLFSIPKIHFYFTRELKDIVDWNENIRKVLIYRLDTVYIGFMFRYIYDKYKSWFYSNRIICFGCGLLIILILHGFRGVFGITVAESPFFMTVLYLPLNSIAVCLLLPHLLEVNLKSKRLSKVFVKTSVLSYSIYLLHYSIILHLLKVLIPSEDFTGLTLWAYTFFYWGLTFLLSYLLYTFYELPFMRYINKRFPKLK
ncbi:acyltransferase family protein [Winogradskyella sp.]